MPQTLPGQEPTERVEAALERSDLHALVAAVRVARRARAEVHGVDSALRELGDRRPRLLGLDLEPTGGAQPFDERVGEVDVRGRRVVDRLPVLVADDLAEPLERFVP